MINLSLITLSNGFAGLKNYKTGDFSLSIPGQTVPAGHTVLYEISITLDNYQAISGMRMRINGHESFWRYLNGRTIVTLPDYETGDMQISVQYSYANNLLTVKAQILALSAPADLTFSSFSIDFSYRLFIPPFN